MYLSFCITILIFAHFLINYFFQCINENVKNWINAAWILIFKKQWLFLSLSLLFFVIFIYNLLSCIFYKEIIFPEKNKMNKTDFNYV